MIHLDISAVYLRQAEPRTESTAVQVLLTTGGTRTRKHHVRIYILYQTYIPTDNDQIGQIYLGQELKVRRIGHDDMIEKDAVYIGHEADVIAQLLDTDGKKIGVTDP